MFSVTGESVPVDYNLVSVMKYFLDPELPSFANAIYVI